MLFSGSGLPTEVIEEVLQYCGMLCYFSKNLIFVSNPIQFRFFQSKIYFAANMIEWQTNSELSKQKNFISIKNNFFYFIFSVARSHQHGAGESSRLRHRTLSEILAAIPAERHDFLHSTRVVQ